MYVAPCKGIRIPESKKLLLVESRWSGMLGFGIRHIVQGIRNPSKDWKSKSVSDNTWNPESTAWNPVFKFARAVKQKVWNEAESRKRDWGEARALRTRKTLTSHFTDFFTDFEEKKPTVLQSTLHGAYI